MNSELERMCKEAIVPQLEVLPRHLTVGTEETQEDLSHYSRYPAEDHLQHATA
jgi:hypothetical protein